METEIARRCLACGAAVRGRAKFCPQCGIDMSEAPTLSREMTPSFHERPRVSESGVGVGDDAPPRGGQLLAAEKEEDEIGEVSVADAAGGRFVLIAGLLCLLSLVILILSYTLR